MALAPVRRVRNAVMKDLGVPPDMMTFVNYRTRFDCRESLAMLKGSGVKCPNLKDFARHRGWQGRAGNRRVVRHWPGRGAQVHRSECHHPHLRA